jgi:acyl-CoA synthetase (AMP-forming)/AMP-acid ligase II
MVDGIRKTLEKCSVEQYETEFADRHLLHGVITKWANETPDKVALIDFDTDRTFTYRELDETTTALALGLLEAGYRPGDFPGHDVAAVARTYLPGIRLLQNWRCACAS